MSRDNACPQCNGSGEARLDANGFPYEPELAIEVEGEGRPTMTGIVRLMEVPEDALSLVLLAQRHLYRAFCMSEGSEAYLRSPLADASGIQREDVIPAFEVVIEAVGSASELLRGAAKALHPDPEA